MDRSEKELWFRAPETQEFLAALRNRFPEVREWHHASYDDRAVQRIAGKHEVLDWIEKWPQT